MSKSFWGEADSFTETPVVIKKLKETVEVPQYQTDNSSGFDLRACLGDDPHAVVYLSPFERVLIGTGLSFELPQGTELQIRSRSGLTLKNGLTVANGTGTIDADYRGEVGVILYNKSSETQTIKNGDRIAQAVLCPVLRASFSLKETLSDTTRGSGGFGSTGV